MENFTSSHKMIWTFVIIALLAIVATAVISLGYKSGTDQGNNNQTGNQQVQIDHKEVPAAQLPEKFPSDLPIEANAKVVDNFNSTISNGNFQATRQYESAKSPDENYKTFESFFAKNGWQTLTSSNTGTDKSLTVEKGDTVIQALFYTNTVSKANIVKISVTVVSAK
jgi:hypothetical protein